MAWGHRVLTDVRCRNAKGTDKPYKLADGGGLYLYVTPTGFRSWRLKYRSGGKEKRLVLGPYPLLSLIEAREARDAARRHLRDGVDPAHDRQQRAAVAAIAAADTFEAVAREWHLLQRPTWRPRYADQILARLKRHLFPAIGALPIRGVTAALVLQAIRKIEAKGSLETAHMVRMHASAVFVFAIATGRADDDPAHVIRSALAPVPTQLQPAALTLSGARTVLARSEAMPGVYAITRLASRLLALTAARPGVVRLAEQSEFEDLDGKAALWRIPAGKMKLSAERRADPSFEFLIPLSRQAVDVVKAAAELAGKRPLLFPAVRSSYRPISDSTLSAFYRAAGFAGAHVPHGWRSSFSTVMNERAAAHDRPGDRAVIDLMLAHIPQGVEARYNRSAYMPRRRALAQEWADLLVSGMPAAASLLEPRHDGAEASRPQPDAPAHDRRSQRGSASAIAAGRR